MGPRGFVIANFFVIVGVCAACLYIGYQHGARTERASWELETTARYAAYVDKLEKLEQAKNDASTAYERELEAARSAALDAPVIRVCDPVRIASSVPRIRPAGGSHDPAPAAWVLPEAPAGDSGRDIGPALNALVLECEAVSARLRGAQLLAE